MRKLIHTILAICLMLLCMSVNAITIQHWKTNNGAQVFFVEAHEIPMVDASIMFDAGSARDGNQFGLAFFTSLMLNEGTSQWSVDEIAQRLENIGALLSVDAGNDSSSISLRSLSDKKYLNPASEMMAAIITHPTFPQKNFQRLQQNLLQSLQRQKENPNSIAGKALLKAIYGNHPYGHSVSGEEDTIKKMTPKTLKQFHQQYYVANNATIAIVGDLTKEEAEVWANQLVVQLPAGKKPAALPLATTQPKIVHQQHIDFNASQNVVQMGELGIPVNDPDFFPLSVGNYIFGGGALSSRLFQQVRDRHGYTYGISSSFVTLKNKGPFLIKLSTRNEVTQPAIKLTQSLLDTFIHEGVTPEELADAKKYLMGSFDLLLSSNSQILSQIATIGFYGLPLDYLDTYRDKVDAVTREQIQQAFAKHIDLKQLVTITVGSQESNG
jgi:zinc protease